MSRSWSSREWPILPPESTHPTPIVKTGTTTFLCAPFPFAKHALQCRAYSGKPGGLSTVRTFVAVVAAEPKGAGRKPAPGASGLGSVKLPRRARAAQLDNSILDAASAGHIEIEGQGHCGIWRTVVDGSHTVRVLCVLVVCPLYSARGVREIAESVLYAGAGFENTNLLAVPVFEDHN